MHRRTGAMGGDAVARRVEMGRGARLAQRVTAGDGNPLGTLVAEGRRAEEDEKIDDSQRKREGERQSAHAQTPGPLARASGVNLKVSRAAEKLAHLISNGSFNNIPRHLLPHPLPHAPPPTTSCRLRPH